MAAITGSGSRGASGSARTRHTFLVAALVVVLLSLAVSRLVFLIHGHELDLLADVIVKQVEEGRAIKRRFAHRVLGPYAVYYLSLTGLSMIAAMKVCYTSWLVAANAAAYATFRRITGDHRASLRYVFAFAALFALLQWQRVHPWDFLDLILFTLLLYGIVTVRRVGFFALLFAVAVLNRETAFVILLWLVIDAVDWPRRRVDWSKKVQLAVAAVLGAAGVAYTVLTRQLLFTTSYLTEVGPDRNNHFFDHKLRVWDNIRHILLSPLNLDEFPTVLFLGFVLGFVVYHRQRIRGALAKVVILLAVVFVGLCAFGGLWVGRSYVTVVPFLLYLHFELTRPAAGGATPVSAT